MLFGACRVVLLFFFLFFGVELWGLGAVDHRVHQVQRVTFFWCQLCAGISIALDFLSI